MDSTRRGLQENETPLNAIEREMQEEMELAFSSPPRLWRVFQYTDRVDHVFYSQMSLDPRKITLHEGQMVEFFPASEIVRMNLAFDDNRTIKAFLKDRRDGLQSRENQ